MIVRCRSYCMKRITSDMYNCCCYYLTPHSMLYEPHKAIFVIHIILLMSLVL